MRLMPLIWIVAATSSTAWAATEEHMETLEVDLDIGTDEWVAIRVNMTSDNDLFVEGMLASCHGSPQGFETVMVQGWLEIEDGAVTPSPHTLDAGSFFWSPQGDSVEFNLNGKKVRLPESEPAGYGACQGKGVGYAGGSSINRSITFVAVASAPQSWIEFTGTWTHGVESFDVRRGHAELFTKNDFASGVHASVYPSIVKVGAGAFMEQKIATQDDTIGWFLPDATLYSSGASSWTCRIDRADCPEPDFFGYIPLSSKGGSEWEFGIELDTKLERPYYALGVIPLGTDDYLG